MDIKIDYTQLFNSQFNDILLMASSISSDGQCNSQNEAIKILIKFANHYGFFGIDAMKFLTDLIKTMQKVCDLMKKAKEENENEN